jgi:hypothetical protein
MQIGALGIENLLIIMVLKYNNLKNISFHSSLHENWIKTYKT